MTLFNEKIDALKCDIFYIDDFIKNLLLKRMTNMDEMKSNLRRLMWISMKSPILKDRDIANIQLEKLKKQIQDVSNGFEYGLYLIQSDDILFEYRKLSQSTKPRSFVSKSAPVSNEIKTRISKLHTSFLQVANDYVVIENMSSMISSLNMGTTCNICYGVLFDPQEDGRSMCRNCGSEIEIMEDVASFKDNDRVKLAPRYKYTTRTYFIDALNNLECKQSKDVEPVISKILDEMKMQSRTPETITLQQLYNIILDLRLNDYYNDVYLIYFKITKKLVFNITSLRSEMIEMHEYISDVYDEIKDDDNAQNVYMKSFRILQLLDYPCSRDQFFYLRDIDNEDKHHRKWKMQMEILASRYPDHVTSNGKPRWRYVATY